MVGSGSRDGQRVAGDRCGKLGAKEVWGCDFDPFAVAVAKHNTERNGTPQVTLAEQDVLKWKPRKKGYDVVMANLFSTVLIEA